MIIVFTDLSKEVKYQKLSLSLYDQTDRIPYLVSIFYLEIPRLAKITPNAHDYITLFHQVVSRTIAQKRKQKNLVSMTKRIP